MKFSDAVKLAEMNSHLIGKSTSGGRIDEIVIYPTDPILYEQFLQEYMSTRNPQNSIVEFINSEVQVGVVIDKFLIEENGVFHHSDFLSLEDKLGIIWH